MQPLQRSEYCLSNNIQEVHFNAYFSKMHSKNSINPVQISTEESIIFFFASLTKHRGRLFFFVKLHGLKPLLSDYEYIHKELNEVGMEQRVQDFKK